MYRSIGLGNSRITSPLPAPTGAYRASCMSAAAKRYKVHKIILAKSMSIPDNRLNFETECLIPTNFWIFQYLRRIFHFRQMDFEFALWQVKYIHLTCYPIFYSISFFQMLYLFYRPQQVYRNFQYRKVSQPIFISWGHSFDYMELNIESGAEIDIDCCIRRRKPNMLETTQLSWFFFLPSSLSPLPDFHLP